MFRVLGFLLVAAVQLGSFCAMAANAPDPVSPGSSFFTSLVAFQKAAGIFSGDTYGAEFTPNLTELNVGHRTEEPITATLTCFTGHHSPPQELQRCVRCRGRSVGRKPHTRRK
jgi:hypothetical protein